MSKYAPLRDYLRMQKLREFVLTFKEIENVIGSTLPKSADRPQWWANTKDTQYSSPQREAWRAAGYDAFLLHGMDKVRFLRKP